MLIARIYEGLPLVCPECGVALNIVAFFADANSFQRILNHFGEPTMSPRIEVARAPPDWLETDFNQTIPKESETAEPLPAFELDQTVSW